MTLPNFLVIGASRCGTTWLHDLLATHPEVYMSEKRKEVNYFTDEFDRGREGYESFFPVDAGACIAIGESTPTYLYREDSARRIAEVENIRKLIAILRNPLDRLISDYFIHYRFDGFPGTLENFIQSDPCAYSHNFYSRHISTYLEFCPQKPLSVLITEEVTGNTVLAQARLAEILGLDAAAFPNDAGKKRVNERTVPRLTAPYSAARKIAKFFRDRDLDHVVNWAHRSGVNRLFGFRKPDFEGAPPHDLMRHLAETFLPEVERVESLIGRNLDIWRNDLLNVVDDRKSEKAF